MRGIKRAYNPPFGACQSILICLTFLCLLLTYAPLYSQIEVTTSNNTDLSVEQLVRDVFVGNGLRVVSINQIGSGQSIGFFDNGSADIGINQGLVLSTGRVGVIDQENTSENTGGTADFDLLTTDPDLQAITPSELKEVVGLEIQFIPQESDFELRYVFASEEYPEHTCDIINDVLGMFISGPNPNGAAYDRDNIALVPDTNDPSGNTFTTFPVWTNSVNPGTVGSTTANFDPDLVCEGPSESLNFSQYYNDNTGGPNFIFDGYLDVFKAKAELIPCEVYTIKIVIGDTRDFDLDSGVFLEGNSIGTTNYSITSNLGLDNVLNEGCTNGTLNIEFDSPVSQQTEIPIQIVSNGADAADPSDYTLSANSFIIPAGQTQASIEITAIEDGNAETIELLKIVDDNGICAVDTFIISIGDNFLSSSFAQFNDESICIPTSLTDLGLPALLARETVFRSQFGLINFGTPASPEVTIEVLNDQSGVFPLAQYFAGLCIEGFTHDNLNEVSIALRSPAGEFYRLVGLAERTGSAFGQDLCFDDAAMLSRIFGNDVAEVGGIWTVLINDNVINSQRGSIDRVAFTGNNPNFLDFVITDASGNSVDGSTVVDDDEVFTIDATDIEGCTFQKTVSIDFSDDLIVPDALSCTEIARDQLEFSWTHPDQNARFEIRIDGILDWTSVGSDRSYIVDNLISDQTVMFSVRTSAATCSSPQVNLICGTSQCIEPDLNIVRRVNNTSACNPNGLVELASLSTKGPYRYFLGAQEFADPVIAELNEGSYTARIIDGFGCEALLDFTIEGLPELRVELEVFNAYCGLEGFADLFVTGGNPPYQYSWSNGSDESTASDLNAGEFNFAVTDASGCMIRDTFMVEASETLTVTINDLVDINCNGEAAGAIDFTIDGGIAPYDIEIRDDLDSLIDLDAMDALRAGSYTISVSDRFNCADEMDFDIMEPEALTVDVASANASCNFEPNGRIALDIAGGSGTYNVDWSTGDTGPVLDQISGGTYTYTITDDRGCSMTDEVTIENESFVEFSLSSQDLGCSNINDGSINIQEITGTIQSIEWMHGATELVLMDLAPDQYCATIVFAGGCTLDTCVTIVAPIPVTAAVGVTDNVCFGESDGSMTLDISEGVGPYVVQLNGESFTTDNTVTIDNLAADAYDVSIIDSRGCGNDIQVVVGAAEELQIAEQIVNNNCKGDVAGSINLSITGVGSVTDVLWDSPDQIIRRGASISGLPTGSYQAQIMTAAGCSFIHTVTITEPDDALGGTVSVSDAVCHGEESGIININRTGGTGPAMYILDGSNTSPDPRFESLGSGSYSIEIIDESECRFLIPDIIVGEPDTFTLRLATDTTTFELQDVDVAVEVNGAQGEYDLFWESDPAGLIPCAVCDSFTFEMIERSIVVAVEAIDDKGCVAYDEQRIFVQRANHVEVPTAFTPNGDGVNDLLDVYGTPNALITEFSVYDRNGVVLYIATNMEANSELNGWDGTYRGEPMPAGPYIWTVAAVFPDGREDKYSGSTHLLR